MRSNTCITCKYHTRPEFNNICLWCDESFSNYEPAEKKEKLMTCIEKYMSEHPDISRADAFVMDIGCPDDYGYLGEPSNCCSDPNACKECWNREIPEEKEKNKMNHVRLRPFEESTSNGGGESRWIIDESEEPVDTTEWPKENPNLLKNNAKNDSPRILDSGDRTQFETGAVRDCQAGKGRCDLLPLDVMGQHMSDPIISAISDFCKTGNETYLYSALWDFSYHWDVNQTENFDRVATNANMFLEVSKHFEDGAVKYGDDNWRKGIPTKRYIDSAVRHYLKFLRGDKDEPHDRAFCWNLLCCIWTCVHKPELNDYAKCSEVIRG